MATTLKRGTRITYTYALGKIVSGKVIRPYSPDMPEWFVCELTDEGGSYRGGCHVSQITVTDNRVARSA